jgi:hypothetical protein
LGDDFLVAALPDETVAVGELGASSAGHVYDLTDRELDENRLRCPNCGSGEVRIFEEVSGLKP